MDAVLMLLNLLTSNENLKIACSPDFKDADGALFYDVIALSASVVATEKQSKVLAQMLAYHFLNSKTLGASKEVKEQADSLAEILLSVCTFLSKYPDLTEKTETVLTALIRLIPKSKVLHDEKFL